MTIFHQNLSISIYFTIGRGSLNITYSWELQGHMSSFSLSFSIFIKSEELNANSIHQKAFTFWLKCFWVPIAKVWLFSNIVFVRIKVVSHWLLNDLNLIFIFWKWVFRRDKTSFYWLFLFFCLIFFDPII